MARGLNSVALMQAMLFTGAGKPLDLVERPDPRPGRGELLVRVEACAVCRTDLHIMDGELTNPRLPLVPGHEIVGIVEAVGQEVSTDKVGKRIGIAWLGQTCGTCSYCRAGAENLCDTPELTGYSRDGGFDCETHTLRFMCRQIVHDDDVARHQGWNENLLHIGLERDAVHRTVEDHGRGHAR